MGEQKQNKRAKNAAGGKRQQQRQQNLMIANEMLVQMSGSDLSIFTKRSGGRCVHYFGAAVGEGDDTRITKSSGKDHPADGNGLPFVICGRARATDARDQCVDGDQF